MSCFIENRPATASVILSTRPLDTAAIIDAGPTTLGFGWENTQHAQPKVKTRIEEPSFVVFDLRQTVIVGNGDKILRFTPTYDYIAALFHTARPNSQKWRIRTGAASTGIGTFDSGLLSLWPVSEQPSPGDFKSPYFYSPEGAHSWLQLAGAGLPPPPTGDPNAVTWLNFDGASGSYLQGPVDPPNTLNLGGSMLGGTFAIAMRVRNSGPPASQLLLQKGATGIALVNDTGFMIGMDALGRFVAGMNDGTASPPSDRLLVGGDYTDNDWHTVIYTKPVPGGPSVHELWVDGVMVASDSYSLGSGSTDSLTVLRVGAGDSGVLRFSGDVERILYTRDETGGGGGDLEVINSYLTGPIEDSEFPEPPFVAAWTISEGAGTVTADRTGNADLSLNAAGVTWQPSQPPAFLSDRYMRIDFDNNIHPLRIGRLVLDLALRPLIPTPGEKPTPLGSPPKPRVTWDMFMDQKQFESIDYAIAFNRGSAPRTLDSWSHDIHLLDGAGTVAACNNVDAADPWSVSQQTIYGYISDRSPVQVQGLWHRSRVSIQGM